MNGNARKLYNDSFRVEGGGVKIEVFRDCRRAAASSAKDIVASGVEFDLRIKVEQMEVQTEE